MMTPDQTVGQPRHLSSAEVYAMVHRMYGGDTEISDACAVTIASWWQSPKGWGEVFAILASTGRFNVTELLQAISVTRDEVVDKRDHACFDMLATWAMHRHDELYP